MLKDAQKIRLWRDRATSVSPIASDHQFRPVVSTGSNEAAVSPPIPAELAEQDGDAVDALNAVGAACMAVGRTPVDSRK